MKRNPKSSRRAVPAGFIEVPPALLDLLCEATFEGDVEAERLLECMEPDGHRVAGFVRFERRGGPLALLNF